MPANTALMVCGEGFFNCPKMDANGGNMPDSCHVLHIGQTTQDGEGITLVEDHRF